MGERTPRGSERDAAARGPVPAATGGARPWDGDGLRLHVLASGSKGNACVVESPSGMLLVDCGISLRQVRLRLAALGLDPARIAAILVTHEHADHIASLGVAVRGLKVPVYASRGTMGSAAWPAGVSGSALQAGVAVQIAGVSVTPFHVPHDAAETLGFRLERAGTAVGLCTDAGELTSQAGELLRDCDVLALEANHDPGMLRSYAGYPQSLKARIASGHGHLSNDQAARALPELVTSRTRAVVGMHLSQHTNAPSVCRTALAAAGVAAHMEVAGQAAPLGDVGR